MKTLLRIFFTLFLYASFSYAVTPYSLEGVKRVNAVVLNKDNLVSKSTIEKIDVAVKQTLVKMGIETSTQEFSNFLVKIDVQKVEKEFAVNVGLILVESVNPVRNKELVITGITYQKSDSFITDDLDNEVYASVVEFLMPLFEEQYKEEN